MRYPTPLSAISVLGLSLAVGCSVGASVDDQAISAEPVTSHRCPEAVTLDDHGAPRNAEGRVRYCWPTDALCSCDQDDDCYALEGHVACLPVLATAPAQDGGAADEARPDESRSDAATIGSSARAAASVDAGARSTAPDDAGIRTAASADAGIRTATSVDAGVRTTASVDAGVRTTASVDAGVRTTASVDAGARDAGAADTSQSPTPTPTPTPAPAPTPAPSGSLPVIGGCEIFPADSPWNQDVSALPVLSNSGAIIANIQAHGPTTIKADFGSDPAYGIPITVAPVGQPFLPVRFTEYGSESDPGPYPTPLSSAIEGGNDHHVLVVHQGSCMLYEMYHASPSGSGWSAGSGAVFDLSSNALRPTGWTSCDQAGLPILPGLARFDEATAGEINHALRVTFVHTRNGFIPPATHPGDTSDVDAPPMGLRLRLRADYDISRFTGHTRVILNALRRYGMFVADTGGNWYISGATDRRWNDSDLRQLNNVPGTAFEAVNTGAVRTR